MEPQRFNIVITVAVTFVIIFSIASFHFYASPPEIKITGYVSAYYNTSGKCGNYEVDIEFKEECDNQRDEKCPGRCDYRICRCFPESEKKTLAEGSGRQFYFFAKQTENETGTIGFDKPGVAFTGTKFTVNGTQTEFRIIVDTNLTWPQKLKTIEGAKVYQLFRFVENISSQNITAATIYFRVYKDWLANSSYSTNEITLRKHSDRPIQFSDDWHALPTELLGESEAYYSYSADAKGFSYFAVAAERPAVCGNNICEKGEDFTNCCSDCGVRFSNEICRNNTITEFKCGDKVCDTALGETQANCCLDCGCPSASETCEFNACQTLILCGNNICEEGESALSCVQDCGNKAFFSPAFLFLLAGLVSVAFIAGFTFKYGKMPGIKMLKTIAFAPQGREERLREKVKQMVGKHSAKEIKEKLLAEGWNKSLVEKHLHEFRPEFEPVVPGSFNIEAHIAGELEKKPVDAVRSELLAKGWPAKTVDKIMQKFILINLAKRYGLGIEPRDREKFSEFVKACKALGCKPHEIKEIFAQFNWDKTLVERALRQALK